MVYELFDKTITVDFEIGPWASFLHSFYINFDMLSVHTSQVNGVNDIVCLQFRELFNLLPFVVENQGL
jgi:hypothetical protein